MNSLKLDTCNCCSTNLFQWVKVTGLCTLTQGDQRLIKIKVDQMIHIDPVQWLKKIVI